MRRSYIRSNLCKNFPKMQCMTFTALLMCNYRGSFDLNPPTKPWSSSLTIPLFGCYHRIPVAAHLNSLKSLFQTDRLIRAVPEILKVKICKYLFRSRSYVAIKYDIFK